MNEGLVALKHVEIFPDQDQPMSRALAGRAFITESAGSPENVFYVKNLTSFAGRGRVPCRRGTYADALRMRRS